MLLLWFIYLHIQECSVSFAAMLKLNNSSKDAKVCKSLLSVTL